MSEAPYQDKTINEFLEQSLFSHFWRTKQLFSDYWRLWLESGVLDFVCDWLRTKYGIPLLDGEEDCQCIEMPVGDFDTVSIDVHSFYDHWEKKEEFAHELEEIVYQLKLHRSAFWFLFERIFYNTSLRFEWEWGALDMEAIYAPLYPIADKLYLEGFTGEELKIIREMLQSTLKKKIGRTPTSEERAEIDFWCNQLRRKTRTLKWLSSTLLVIKQMKKYKKRAQGRDKNNNIVANLRQTSDQLAMEISGELPADLGMEPDAFRQRVRYLYKQFPILREFIAAQQQPQN